MAKGNLSTSVAMVSDPLSLDWLARGLESQPKSTCDGLGCDERDVMGDSSSLPRVQRMATRAFAAGHVFPAIQSGYIDTRMDIGQAGKVGTIIR